MSRVDLHLKNVYMLNFGSSFMVSDPTRLPTHKDLEKARLLTYGSKSKMWPHDSKRSHGATSKKVTY